ncbi:MAG: hypothetical protein RML15_07870 [Bacteroidota bacterium]|nr:hypothetical protein [Candidatus Kapabacteria bacterium]MDW8272305.1 hypothetical protein [Bacteroidota bacterium]
MPQMEHRDSAGAIHLRVVVQQAFIDRAEFLDVQRGVVDAVGAAARLVAVIDQMPECRKQIAVGNRAGIEVLIVEQLPIEHRHSEQGGVFFGGEYLPEHAEALPEVVVVVGSGGEIHQPAQPCDAVVIVVEGVGAEQPTLFGNQQEEEAVNQPQQLAVEVLRGKGRRTAVSPHAVAELLVCGMAEKAICQQLDATLDAIAQMLADASSLLFGMAVVALQIALVRIGDAAGKAATVDQPVQQSKIGEQLLFDDGAEVEFDVRLAANEGAIAQQPEHVPIGDNAPEVFGAIEVLLHQRMGRKARTPRWRKASQLLPNSNNVHGRRIRRLIHAMGDGKAHVVDPVRLGVEVRRIAQKAQ